MSIESKQKSIMNTSGSGNNHPYQPQQQQHQQTATGNYNSKENSLTIRQEIQRFESVHPSIYAIYDLIELIPDVCIAQHIRDHVVCIEDSFVNSQEWTLSRSVPDLRLGVIGSITSGKSALVHRYLTGSYMQEESPEGGRFKKEIVVNNLSYLLLIRDEGGPPEQQFTLWIDAVILVFSLENEESFGAVWNYFSQMSTYRNLNEIPVILVGTQDAINETNPQVIDDSRARKFASDLKKCSYYETCATYGLNVDRVFQDACQKIVQQKCPSAATAAAESIMIGSRPSTPNLIGHFHGQIGGGGGVRGGGDGSGSVTGRHFQTASDPLLSTAAVAAAIANQRNASPTASIRQIPQSTAHSSSGSSSTYQTSSTSRYSPALSPNQVPFEINPNSNGVNISTKIMHPLDNLQSIQKETKEMTVAAAAATAATTAAATAIVSTPTAQRKNRRKSNIFTPSKKNDDGAFKLKHGTTELGSGRMIPLKQGQLYKKSNKPLKKEWKKKYVTLCDDGRLTYHPSLQDYMNNTHGKEILLQFVTVKVPGKKPRGSKSIITIANEMVTGSCSAASGSSGHFISDSLNSLSLSKSSKKKSILSSAASASASATTTASTTATGTSSAQHSKMLTAYEVLQESDRSTNNDDTNQLLPTANGPPDSGSVQSFKKKHRRLKNNSLKNDGHEFYIVSLDNKQWYFEASSIEERDEWVAAIEQQILLSLQGLQLSKNNFQSAFIHAIQTDIAGNNQCADCNASNPEWASVNLGVLLCIECSGIHRNMGSHISKVRSLNLDDWPPGHLSVMMAVGNQMANSIFEYRAPLKLKPEPNTNREQKELWIRSKYELKEFLSPPAPSATASTTTTTATSQIALPPTVLLSTSAILQNLIDAICRNDTKNFILHLYHIEPDQLNSTISNSDHRTPLHLACAMTNLAFVQLLIWNNANVSSMDQYGRTCLNYVQTASHLNGTASTASSASSSTADSNTVKDLIDLLVSSGCPSNGAGGSSSNSTINSNENRTKLSQNRDPILEKLPSSFV